MRKTRASISRSRRSLKAVRAGNKAESPLSDEEDGASPTDSSESVDPILAGKVELTDNILDNCDRYQEAHKVYQEFLLNKFLSRRLSTSEDGDDRRKSPSDAPTPKGILLISSHYQNIFPSA